MNPRELNTVLAALRLWQSGVHHPLELETIATNDGESEPLDGEEIDALCERLNGGEDDTFRDALQKLHDAIGHAADAGNWGAQALDNCPEIIAARALLMEGT
jgi:hypothetical protein